MKRRRELYLVCDWTEGSIRAVDQGEKEDNPVPEEQDVRPSPFPPPEVVDFLYARDDTLVQVQT